MGSQTLVTKKCNPNLCRGSVELIHNCQTNRIVINTTEAANKKVMRRAISSPSRRRDINEREPVAGPAVPRVVLVVATITLSRLLNLANCFLFLLQDFLRQLGVGKSFHQVLAVA